MILLLKFFCLSKERKKKEQCGKTIQIPSKRYKYEVWHTKLFLKDKYSLQHVYYQFEFFFFQVGSSLVATSSLYNPRKLLKIVIPISKVAWKHHEVISSTVNCRCNLRLNFSFYGVSYHCVKDNFPSHLKYLDRVTLSSMKIVVYTSNRATKHM